jgi:UDP-N-acetylglucosamine--N-acetylmuramyl-(pentapeptide) pyrophosphoryl-undecaprenol N-acetylglucosamine transferase
MPWQMATNAVKIGAGVQQARAILGEFGPQVVLSTGGYASFPVALAARGRNIPLAVYLPDLSPGWAVRAIARLAQKVAVTAIESLRRFPSNKTVVTGYPVRSQFWTATRNEGRERLGINPEEKVLFVGGGSTGAHRINRAVAAELSGLLELCEVIHVSGPGDEPWLREIRDGMPDGLRARYHLHGYMHDEMPLAMAAADLALCRSGASTIGELPALGLPAVLVPLPLAGAHQRTNAHYLEKYGAATVLEEDYLDNILPVVGTLLHDEKRLRGMRDASRRLARPNAATRIAGILFNLARGGAA